MILRLLFIPGIQRFGLNILCDLRLFGGRGIKGGGLVFPDLNRTRCSINPNIAFENCDLATFFAIADSQMGSARQGSFPPPNSRTSSSFFDPEKSTYAVPRLRSTLESFPPESRKESCGN